MWDVSTGALLNEFEAHSKRIWSVDFCEADPTLLASGSDDCAVKFWSTNCASSVAQVGGVGAGCTEGWHDWTATALGPLRWIFGRTRMLTGLTSIRTLAPACCFTPCAALPPRFSCWRRWRRGPTCARCGGVPAPAASWRWGLQTTACTFTTCATQPSLCAHSRATGAQGKPRPAGLASG